MPETNLYEALTFFILIVGGFGVLLLLAVGLEYLLFPSMRETIKEDWNRK